MPELSAVIENAVLNETENALRDFVQAALNVGLSRMQIVKILRDVAEENEPAATKMLLQ